VIRGQASFTFSSAVPEWVLCYQFVGEAYTKYENLPIADISVSSSGEAVSVAPEPVSPSLLEKAEVQLTLALDIKTIPPGSEAETNFKESFTSDVARAVSIDPSRIVVKKLTKGTPFAAFHKKLLDSFVGNISLSALCIALRRIYHC
jgi:hypothetical protein